MKRIISLLLLTALSSLPYTITAQDTNMQKMKEIISELKKQFPGGTIFEVASKSIYEYMYDNKNVGKDIQNRHFENLLKNADSSQNTISQQTFTKDVPNDKDSVLKYNEMVRMAAYKDSIAKQLVKESDDIKRTINSSK